MGDAGNEHDDETRAVPPDDDGGDHPRGTVPHPLDRIWLHPSELSPLVPTSTMRPRPMWTATLVAGAAGAILTLAVLSAVGGLGGRSKRDASADVVPTSAPIATARIVAIAVGNSVVAVSARDARGARRGSGVIVRHSGQILTSSRLVGTASTVNVTTADGVVHRARIIGRDATTDLVLLGLDSGLPAAQFSTRVPRAGDTAWVVGARRPGDASPWMSSGLVSSTDSLVALGSGPTTSGLLETAAASSAASSGGALVDPNGNVTGIVLSPISDNRMTYAVPIATALSIADDLSSHGFTRHGALGINGTNSPVGPTITGLVAGGPAARAGVHVGDVVESVENHDVNSMEEVMALVRHDRPGRSIALELQRGSSTISVRATLSAMVAP